jgi:hypothetical protein
MSYDVQTKTFPALVASGPGMPANAEFSVQDPEQILHNRTASFPYDTQPPIQSRVRVKRPDGTWATVVQVLGVHIQMPDGTWQVIE